MRLGRNGRSVLAVVVSATVVLGVFVTATLARGVDDSHPVVGRWNVEAEPGGSVWAFQPSGALIVSGPGEIMSEGTWTAAEEEGAFDAQVDVNVTGQLLEVLGQVADDGSMAALYVAASEATRPDDWTPWPSRSRLVAPRFGMLADGSPLPGEAPLECLRPEWLDGGDVDWDRCDDGLTLQSPLPTTEAG